MNIKVFFLFLAFVFAGAVSGADGEKISPDVPEVAPEINSILATVNGSPILLADVLPVTRAREYQAYAAYSGDRLQNAIKELRRQTVDELIDRQLMIADYRNQSYRIASQDIQNEIDKVAVRMGCQSRAEFRQKLSENNMTMEALSKEVEESMIVRLMQFRKVTIAGSPSPKEVYDYFKAHSEDFNGEELITLAMIKLEPDRPDLAQVSAEIDAILKQSPERFSELVLKYTPAADSGKIAYEIECRKLRPEFSSAITDFTAGKIYGPLKLDDGVIWLQIVSRKEAVKVGFHEVEEKIIEQLEAAARKKALQEYSAFLREKALIEYFF